MALTSGAIITLINNDFVNQLATAGGAVGNWDSAAFVTAVTPAAIAPAIVGVPTQPSIAAGLVGAAGLNIPAGELRNLVTNLAAKEVLNPKTNRIIYNVPKSDELLRRFVSTLFAKSKGVDITTAAVPNGVDSDLTPTMQGNVVESMPKSDSDVYISLLTISSAQRANFNKFDTRVDEIRSVLSQGVGPQPSVIPPGNVIPVVARNSISVFSSYPAGLRDALVERRKSDPSNPLNAAATLNRIRISMNGGANNMTGDNLVGGNASKAAPLYPRFVMHGGAHPLAVMEGGAAGAWALARDSPNPVAVLDARIKELEAQFKAATGQGIQAGLANTIRGYADTVNTNIGNVQKSLKELAEANAALAQYPVGMGMNASSFDGPKLKAIAEQAEKINKDAAKASKQLDKLSQIKDTLEELVKKSAPAPRV